MLRPSAASLRLLRLSRVPARQLVTAHAKRIHTANERGTDSKQYPELEDILGKPAATFEQLIEQLETLIKHPNPPRNYADALAKEELRRLDNGDLALNNPSGERDPSRARLLRQRPRMLRHMHSEMDRGFDAEEAAADSADADNADLTDLSEMPRANSSGSGAYEVPPLPEEVAINLGITAEQQQRRRIWMTKIAGYRDFRSNLVSMDKLLSNLDERREAEKRRAESAPTADDALGEDPLIEPELADDALLNDDREFERLIRKSWQLYDEDFVESPEPSTAAADGSAGSVARPKHSSSPGFNGSIQGKRSFHTSRAALEEPNARSRVSAKSWTSGSSRHGDNKPRHKPACTTRVVRRASNDKDVSSNIGPQGNVRGHQPSFSNNAIAKASVVKPGKGPRNLIRAASKPGIGALRRHFAERTEYANETYVPIDATVSTGDIIEMRLAVSQSVGPFSTDITLGGVIQRTTGRFHFNLVEKSGAVTGGREARLGFVAKGLLFDKKLLHRSGVAGADIARLLAYDAELREYELAHGEHVMTNAQEAMNLQRLANQPLLAGLASDDVDPDASLPMLKTKDDQKASSGARSAAALDNEAEAEREEDICDLMLRVVPRVLRTFEQDAERLMRSHIRELGSYWDMAINSQQTHVTIDALAKLAFHKGLNNEVSNVERFAAYVHMVSDSLHYIPDADGLFVTGRFELRSRSEVINIERVRNLIRENAATFQQFIEKARELVAYSHASTPLSPLRVALDPTAKDVAATNTCHSTGWKRKVVFSKRQLPAGPVLSVNSVAGLEVVDGDLPFIQALCSYVFQTNSGYQNQTNPYESLVSPIIKKMNYYGGCDATNVARFLVDLGVWPHWFNYKLSMRDVSLTTHDRGRKRYLVSKGATGCAISFLYRDPDSVDGGEAFIADTASKVPVEATRDLARLKRAIVAAERHVPEVRRSIITQSNSKTGVVSSSKLYGRDICENIRHDFGDMPVYTIDDANTRDVDDGLSLEMVTSASGEVRVWVHVHVADPSAIVHPGHLISHAAMQQAASIYYATGTESMISKRLVEDKISLVQRGQNEPVHTMTFSFRLDETGDIAEYKVRPGIVRNIRAAPYEVVDQVLSYEGVVGGLTSLEKLQESQRMTTLIHPFLPSDASYKVYGKKQLKLTERAIQDLRMIQVISRRHFEFRVRAGSFTRLIPSPEIHVGASLHHRQPGFIPSNSEYLAEAASGKQPNPLQYPRIITSCSYITYSPAHTLVAEMMVIAGRVCARFAYEHGPEDGSVLSANGSGVITGDRGVPMLFRVQYPPNLDALCGAAVGLPLAIEGLSASEAASAQAVWDAVVKGAKNNRGIVSARHFDELRHMLSPSIFSSTPGPHNIMGINDHYGYVRISSPIRRADDLVGHWQIKAQLLAEYGGGSSDKQPWYWNRYDIERLAPVLFRRGQLVDKASKLDEEFWLLTLMRRMEVEARRGKLQLPPNGFYDANSPLYYDSPWAYYNPSQPGPLTWTATVDNRDESRQFISLIIVGTGARAMLIPRPLDPAQLPFAGTKIRVQITGLDPADGLLMVKLAPEEFQPPETPKFWRSAFAINLSHTKFHVGRVPPEDLVRMVAPVMAAE
ncbi:3'-5' RNA exonuclease complex component [Coemansia thaxteri]|uniref:3'-5' RNA exonuclease complex component n=1 Tax=Coemansia thaxteri TaxID=2663907 RepID=A0A9W8BEE5_9FUNG|nr:3'-5' RNA exonuclease complex component [Coemansia thaxteri]